MNPYARKEWIEVMRREGWHLNTHSTICSRRLEGHRFIGRLHFVKPLRILEQERQREKMTRHAMNYGMGTELIKRIITMDKNCPK